MKRILVLSLIGLITISCQQVDHVTPTDTYIGKQTELKTDANDYVTSTTLTYDDGFVSKTTYSLINCS